jgi:hypothetical protein
MNLAELSNTVLLVAGLPGSGKTTLATSLEKHSWLVFDDYKAHAIDNSPAFSKSPRFVELIHSIRAGRKCVVVDIDFCVPESRSEAELVLQAEVPSIRIQWVFFAKDEPTCEANIRFRNSKSINANFRELRKYSKIYTIPPHAEVLPVVRADQQAEPQPPR